MRGNPAPLQEALQRGIQRAVVHGELVPGLMLEELRDAVSVVRSRLQAAKNQDLEGPLQKFEGFGLVVYCRHSTCILQTAVFVKRGRTCLQYGDKLLKVQWRRTGG